MLPVVGMLTCHLPLSPPNSPSPPADGPLTSNINRPLVPPFTPTIQSHTKTSIETSSQHGLLNRRLSSSSNQSDQNQSTIQSPLVPSRNVLPQPHTQTLLSSDSPVLSNNASPSIALSSLSLRTPQHRPLPLFLPPAPSTLTSTATTARNKPDFHALRTSYTKMLGKKTASSSSVSDSTMPPPPVPARAMSAAVSTSTGDDMAVDSRSGFADDHMDLEQLLSQGEYDFRSVFIIEARGGAGRPVNPELGDPKSHAFPQTLRTATRSSQRRAWVPCEDDPFGADYPDSLVYADSHVLSSAAAGALFGGPAPGLTGLATSASGDASAFALLNLLASPPPLQPLYQLPPTPLSTYASSPFLDELHTPLVYNSSGEFSPEIVDGNNSTTTSPTFNLFEDFDTHQSFNLFNFNKQMANSNAPQANANHPSLPSTITPTDLGLQLKTSLSRESSWDYHPTSSIVQQRVSPADSDIGSTSPPPSARSKSSQPTPNGVRKNVTVHDLIPLDAPIQARNYITPSATSRKELPPSVAKTFVPHSRKRSASTAFTSPTDHDELADEDPASAESEEVLKRRREMDPEKAALLEHVEQARRRNTMAARKSRQRKLEHVRGLEEIVERLQSDNEELRRRLGERDDECETLKLRVAELEKGGG